jgi:hypothetical protein
MDITTNKKCKKCNKVFTECWMLLRHRKGPRGCKYIDTDDNNYNNDTNNAEPNLSIKTDFINSTENMKINILEDDDITKEEKDLNNIQKGNDINDVNIVKEEIVVINNFVCSYCDSKFKYKRNLMRHINSKKCLEKHNKNKNNNIKLVKTHLEKLVKDLLVNGDTQCNGYNTSNTKTTKTTNNINNGVINNTINNTINNINNINITNNMIIQYINPFGYENTDFLTFEEKLEILRSSHMACIKILRIVYSRRENKNFYKANKKNASISYLNENLDFGIFQEQQFRIELFKNSTTLLYGIMLDCKDKLEFNEQLQLMENITSIKNDVYAEIFNNGLSNLRREIGEPIMDTDTKNDIGWELTNVIHNEIDNRNEVNKKLIKDFIDNTNSNKDIKQFHKDKLYIAKKKKEQIQYELNDTNLNMQLVDEKYGKIRYNELAEQLQLSYYNDTEFAKNLNARQKMEEKIIIKNNTLGKLNSYSLLNKNRKKKIEHVLEFEQDLERLQELSTDKYDIENENDTETLLLQPS